MNGDIRWTGLMLSVPPVSSKSTVTQKRINYSFKMRNGCFSIIFHAVFSKTWLWEMCACERRMNVIFCWNSWNDVKRETDAQTRTQTLCESSLKRAAKRVYINKSAGPQTHTHEHTQCHWGFPLVFTYHWQNSTAGPLITIFILQSSLYYVFKHYCNTFLAKLGFGFSTLNSSLICIRFKIELFHALHDVKHCCSTMSVFNVSRPHFCLRFQQTCNFQAWIYLGRVLPNLQQKFTVGMGFFWHTCGCNALQGFSLRFQV